MRKVNSKKELEKRKSEKKMTKGDRGSRKSNNLKVDTDDKDKRRGSALLIQQAWKTSSGRKITKSGKVAITNDSPTPKNLSPKSGSPKRKEDFKMECGFKIKKCVGRAKPGEERSDEP